MTKDEYKSKPMLAELAFQLNAKKRHLQAEGKTEAEIFAYLRAYAEGYLDPLKRPVLVHVSNPDDPNDQENTMRVAAGRSGLPTGVKLSANGTKYIATIRAPVTREYFYLGVFDTPEEAHEAFKAKHRELHGERSRYREELPA